MYSTTWHKTSHQRSLARRVDVFAYYSVHFLALLGLDASDHSQWASSFRRDRVCPDINVIHIGRGFWAQPRYISCPLYDEIYSLNPQFSSFSLLHMRFTSLSSLP